MSNTVLPLIPLRPAPPPAPPCGAPAVPELPPRDALASAVRELKSRLDAIVVAKADLVNGKVPAGQLPSYVDDVVEVAALPSSGESGKLYVVTGTNAVYRWSGSSFVEVSPSRDWSGELARKQDVIPDLEAIRSKANSALQAHQDISGKRDLTDLSVDRGKWLLVKPDGTQARLEKSDPQRDAWTGDGFTLAYETTEAYWGLVKTDASGAWVVDDSDDSPPDADKLKFLGSDGTSVYRLVRGSRLALDTEIPAVDDVVTRTSANPVKSSGIWGAIWGALTALPTGVASLYDWCVSRLAGKRGLDDLSYKRQDPSEGGWILHMDGSDVRLLPAGELTWTNTGSETDWTYNLKWLGQWHLAYVSGSGLATCVDQESQEDATELTLVSTSDYETVVATATAATVDDELALMSEVGKKQDALTAAQLAAANSGATAAKVATWDGYAAQIAAKASAADLRYRIAEAELTAKLPTGVTLAKDGAAVDHEFHVYSDHISILPDDIEKEVFSWDLDGTNGRDGADYGYDNLVLVQNGSVVQPSAVELTVFCALADRTVNVVNADGSTSIDIELPVAQEGHSRDFYLAVTCGSTAPTLNARVTLVNAKGEPPDLSLSTDSTTVLKFTEVNEAVADPASPAVFCVTGGANGGGSLDLSILADEFSEQATYEVGDIVQYQGELYMCEVAVETPGGWDSSDWTSAEPVLSSLMQVIRGKADSSALAAKAESTALAPAWISGHAYFKGDRVSYEGLLYECLSTVAGSTDPSADTTHWKLTDLAAPDATLDILSDGRLRVVAADGTPMWTQGYELASESAVALSCEKSNYYSFSAPAEFSASTAYAAGDQVTYTENDVTKVYQFNAAHAAGAWTGTDVDEAPIRQKFALPKAPSGVVGDFVLDIANTAAFEAEVVLDGVLGTDYDVIVEKGRALSDVLSIPAAADGVGALVELYFTMTAFGTAAKPAWRVVRLNVERQEVGS